MTDLVPILLANMAAMVGGVWYLRSTMLTRDEARELFAKQEDHKVLEERVANLLASMARIENTLHQIHEDLKRQESR